MNTLKIILNSAKAANITTNITKNITFAINQSLNTQGITGLFGSSGSGKTTLLRAIAGLDNHLQGEIVFKGKTLLHSQQNIFVKPAQRHIGLVFANSRLFPHLSVYNNLAYAHKRCKKSQLTVQEIITLTELEPLIDKYPQQLSTGEQQRVAIARAILAEPELLLLDEPLSALDHTNKGKLLSLLLTIQKQLNIPMLYVSHSLAELQQTADNLLVMSQGNIIDYGNIHHVIHRLNQPHKTININQQTSLTLFITAHHPQQGLTELQLSKFQLSELPLNEQQPLFIPLLDSHYQAGSSLRCFIFASDISISLVAPHHSSIVNHLKGTVTAITPLPKHSVLVSIQCNKQIFYSRISLMSYQKLALNLTDEVFIQFKASAIKTLTTK